MPKSKQHAHEPYGKDDGMCDSPGISQNRSGTHVLREEEHDNSDDTGSDGEKQPDESASPAIPHQSPN